MEADEGNQIPSKKEDADVAIDIPLAEDEKAGADNEF